MQSPSPQFYDMFSLTGGRVRERVRTEQSGDALVPSLVQSSIIMLRRNHCTSFHAHKSHKLPECGEEEKRSYFS